LEESSFFRADLRMAIIKECRFERANFCESNLEKTNFSGSDLSEANFTGANLSNAILVNTNLFRVDFYKANLSNADLTKARLFFACLVETNLKGSNLSNCEIYGISAWQVETDDKTDQSNLIINRREDPIITVDNLEVAQFVHMIMTHKKIRTVIDTMTGKGVLLLGRFGDGRKSILDGIADVLRKKNLLPIIFDFDPPRDRDVTETVMTLAGLCKYIIADLTMPMSVGQESRTIIPDLAIPFVPLIEGDENPYSMFPDLLKYPWVLDLVRYENRSHLMTILQDNVLRPAEQKYLFWQERKKEFQQAMYKKV
jgi:uncharacterized protein YjbI with pentapeptide repeats